MDASVKILFIGNDDRMEAQLVPQAGYDFTPLHTSGLVGNVFQKGKAVLQMLGAQRKAKAILRAFQADVVIGFGGYVSAPVILAAHALGIKTVIHEQNSIVGKANQLVMHKVDAIVTCYEKCQEVFPKDKIHLLGNPRATVAAQAQLDLAYWSKLGLSDQKKTILVMMGSLGSSSINALMQDALVNIDPSLQFLYVCGKDNSQNLNLFARQETIHVVDYVDTLKIYPKIDGLICRAGATTIAELTALGIPSILIPSPYVANNHQFYNANVLVEKEAAAMIEEKDLNAQTLKRTMNQIFLDSQRYEQIHQNALAFGKPLAAQAIVSLCQDLTEK